MITTKAFTFWFILMSLNSPINGAILCTTLLASWHFSPESKCYISFLMSFISIHSKTRNEGGVDICYKFERNILNIYWENHMCRERSCFSTLPKITLTSAKFRFWGKKLKFLNFKKKKINKYIYIYIYKVRGIWGINDKEDKISITSLDTFIANFTFERIPFMKVSNLSDVYVPSSGEIIE